MFSQFQLQSAFKKPFKLVAMAIVLSSFAGCSGADFRPLGTTQNVSSPGGYTTPPKLDFLLVMDDTGSAYQSYSTLSSQVSSFMSQLDAQQWDYRLATIPLTTYRQISQVVGSVYDPNRGTSWVAPYPGALTSMMETLLSSVFRLPANYTDILTLSNISSAGNGQELGFKNILNSLTSSSASSFLRKDAQLAILVQSNGDDTDLNYCTRPADGRLVPCEQLGNAPCVPTAQDPIRGGSTTCSANQTSLNYYTSALQAVNPNLLFYSFVANSTSSSCLSGNSYLGTRYMTMAAALNGSSFDICSLTLSQVLTSLNSKLLTQKTNYHQQYLFFAQQPNASTISYVKNPGGDTTQGINQPQSLSNGWTYVGYQSNVYAIYAVNAAGAKFQMNQQSGYALQLHGTGELVGSDTATLQDTPDGVTSSK